MTGAVFRHLARGLLIGDWSFQNGHLRRSVSELSSTWCLHTQPCNKNTHKVTRACLSCFGLVSCDFQLQLLCRCLLVQTNGLDSLALCLRRLLILDQSLAGLQKSETAGQLISLQVAACSFQYHPYQRHPGFSMERRKCVPYRQQQR